MIPWIFSRSTVSLASALDGILTGDNAIPGGWFSRHWVQMGYQVAYICATCAYSFVVTAIILYAMNIIPGLQLRVSRDAEREGIDEAELGEFAFDFVEVRRIPGTPPIQTSSRVVYEKN